jgi:hypothetical protein
MRQNDRDHGHHKSCEEREHLKKNLDRYHTYLIPRSDVHTIDTNTGNQTPIFETLHQLTTNRQGQIHPHTIHTETHTIRNFLVTLHAANTMN